MTVNKSCAEAVEVVEKFANLLEIAVGPNDLLWEELINCIYSFFEELWILGADNNDTLFGLEAALKSVPNPIKDALVERIISKNIVGMNGGLKALQIKMIYGLSE